MRPVWVVLLLAWVLVAALSTAAPAADAQRTCRAGVLHPVGTERVAYAAVVKKTATRVFRRPAGTGLARFTRLNQNGYPTTFEIVGAIVNKACGVSWYRVKLPMRPNGAVGYVRPQDVRAEKVTTRLVVDLSERRLVLYDDGRRVLSTAVAVGSMSTPTPTGRFYVNQRFVIADPKGPYGPAALGVSAFSDVLIGWAQGGPIGIHGTNEPWSIGRAVSNGCIRVPNDALKRIFAATPGGSPVIIRA